MHLECKHEALEDHTGQFYGALLVKVNHSWWAAPLGGGGGGGGSLPSI